MSVSFSPQEITALLLEIDRNDTPTDTLIQARHKLVADYQRQTHTTPSLEQFRDDADRQELRDVSQHQQTLIDGYYALDPAARCLGYFKGNPVIQAYTAPIRMRSTSARRNVVVVSRDGAPGKLPLSGWADNFIPAQGVTWSEAEAIISDWLVHNQKKLVSG